MLCISKLFIKQMRRNDQYSPLLVASAVIPLQQRCNFIEFVFKTPSVRPNCRAEATISCCLHLQWNGCRSFPSTKTKNDFVFRLSEL